MPTGVAPAVSLPCCFLWGLLYLWALHVSQEGAGERKRQHKRLPPSFLWLECVSCHTPDCWEAEEGSHYLFQTLQQRQAKRKGLGKRGGWAKFWCWPPSLFPTPVGQKKLSCPFIPRASECCFYRKENIDCRGSGCKWAFILILISHPLDICFSKLENIGVFPWFSSIFFHSTAQFFQQWHMDAIVVDVYCEAGNFPRTTFVQ